MASENNKAIEETRKRNDKAMTEKADLESNIIFFPRINKKYFNELENSSVQVASIHIKPKGLNNAKHQMQQENAHMMEHPGQFEIIEAKLQYE